MMKRKISVVIAVFIINLGFGQIIVESVSQAYPITNYREFDLDGNGLMDFRIVFNSSEIRFEGINGTEFETDGNEQLVGFNGGIQLGNLSYESIAKIYNNSSYFPLSSPTILKFAGLKFKIQGQYRCAYLKIGKRMMSNTVYFEFDSYGYELDVTKCIKTGELPSSVDIKELPFYNSEVQVFPNPSTGNFNIDLGENHQNVSYTLLDVFGKVIYPTINIAGQVLNVTIKESSGVYILKLQTPENKYIVRLIKE